MPSAPGATVAFCGSTRTLSVPWVKRFDRLSRPEQSGALGSTVRPLRSKLGSRIGQYSSGVSETTAPGVVPRGRRFTQIGTGIIRRASSSVLADCTLALHAARAATSRPPASSGRAQRLSQEDAVDRWGGTDGWETDGWETDGWETNAVPECMPAR